MTCALHYHISAQRHEAELKQQTNCELFILFLAILIVLVHWAAQPTAHGDYSENNEEQQEAEQQDIGPQSIWVSAASDHISELSEIRSGARKSQLALFRPQECP